MPSDDEKLPLALYLPGLRRLVEEGADLTLVAGQAVNLWAERYKSIELALLDFVPFVSKDADLFGEDENLYRMQSMLDGELTRFRDVRQSVVGIFETNDSPPLKFELLRTVYGPVSSKRISERAHLQSGIRVMDPISLLAAKCHNVAGIDQENRQDVRHVKMMVLVSRAFVSDFLSELGKRVSPRQVINELKYLIELAEHVGFRKGLSMSGHVFSECLPLEDLQKAAAGAPQLERFVENTLASALERLSK